MRYHYCHSTPLPSKLLPPIWPGEGDCYGSGFPWLIPGIHRCSCCPTGCLSPDGRSTHCAEGDKVNIMQSPVQVRDLLPLIHLRPGSDTTQASARICFTLEKAKEYPTSTISKGKRQPEPQSHMRKRRRRAAVSCRQRAQAALDLEVDSFVVLDGGVILFTLRSVQGDLYSRVSRHVFHQDATRHSSPHLGSKEGSVPRSRSVGHLWETLNKTSQTSRPDMCVHGLFKLGEAPWS